MVTILLCIFALGYLAIVFETVIKINKTASAIVTGVLCWVVLAFFSENTEGVHHALSEKFAEICEILFFLLGAMTIVELVDAHDGFDVLVEKITTRNKRKLLWIIGLVTFFLSAVLDNLTTTIVMVSFLRKLFPTENVDIQTKEEKKLLVGIIIIAANAGGAWSPIGDVTTTMLWIGGQVTSIPLMTKLFLPSLACLIVPILLISRKFKGILPKIEITKIESETTLILTRRHQILVFSMGIGALLFVPIFKTLTGLPPYLGMLLALGVLWVALEMLHSHREDDVKHALTPLSALQRIDTPSILFFLGILLAVASLETTGILRGAAESLNTRIGNPTIIATCIGLASAVVDNVPLLAASMGMFSLQDIPQNDTFWHIMAYCTGTGGSILIIGSAAGVAAMGLEKIDFIWYFKRVSWLALLGYFVGILVFVLEPFLLN